MNIESFDIATAQIPLRQNSDLCALLLYILSADINAMLWAVVSGGACQVFASASTVCGMETIPGEICSSSVTVHCPHCHRPPGKLDPFTAACMGTDAGASINDRAVMAQLMSPVNGPSRSASHVR